MPMSCSQVLRICYLTWQRGLCRYGCGSEIGKIIILDDLRGLNVTTALTSGRKRWERKIQSDVGCSLAGLLRGLEHHPVHQKTVGSIPGQGTH